MHKLILASILTLSLFAQTKKSLPSAILYQSGVPSIACTVSNNYGTISVDFVGGALYVCKSTGWVSSGLAFSSFGTDGMIPFRSGAGAVVGDSGLTWNNTTKLATFGDASNYVTIGKWPTASPYGAIYFNQAAPGANNYTIIGTGGASYINGPADLFLRVGNENKLVLNATTATFSVPIVSTQGTLTGASTPFLSHTVTLNNAGTTFVIEDSNVTDTNSASGTILFRRQVNGITQFSVRKDGVLSSAGGFQRAPIAIGSLPTCNAGNDGLTRYVNDASGPAFNTTVTGGGATKVMVYCNGTNWTAY